MIGTHGNGRPLQNAIAICTGSKYQLASGSEFVSKAGHQRGFRADDGEGNFFLLHKGNQFLDIGDRQVFNTFGTRGTAIARGNVDSLHACRLGQAPCQGVFTAAAANN